MTESSFDIDFPTVYRGADSKGVIKQHVEDFFVEELFAPELSGEGEHVWLFVEKQGQNSEYVAEHLARFAGVKQMDVGLSGLKDRWALTRQWFSVYLGNKSEPDWQNFSLDGVKVLSHVRHQRKLRRGEHSGNKFRIRVRELIPESNLEDILQRIKTQGFPNYFGPQRFGLNGANLSRGYRFFKGQLKASRSQRSFYLSAARSYLFNLNLARVIQTNSWEDSPEGGPLYGDPVPGLNTLTAAEQQILDAHPVFADAIHKNRLKLERRPYLIIPQNLKWCINSNELLLEFDLPSGCFATSLLAELLKMEVGLGVSI